MTDSGTQQNSPRQSVQRVIAALLSKDHHEAILANRLPEDLVQRAAIEVENSIDLADQLLVTLFPQGCPADESFYDKLAEVEYRLGHHGQTHRLNGLLWASAFNRLAVGNALHLLEALTQKNSRSFFSALHAYPTFLSLAAIPTEFLSRWIVSVRKRLGNDGASGGFWDGLQSLAAAHPETALEVSEALVSSPVDEDMVAIAANLLGHLRVTAPDLPRLPDLLERLSRHPHVDRRLVFHRSWVITGLQRPLSDQEFADILDRTSIGTQDEIDEAFNALRILLPLRSTSDASFLLGMRWLNERTSKAVGDFWKYFVISLARQLHVRWTRLGKPAGVPSLVDLVVALQPIREDQAGIWHELEQLLVFLLTEDYTAFRSLLFDLIRSDHHSLPKRFSSHEGFNELIAAIKTHSSSELIVDALLSNEEAIRHLGFCLFDGVGVEELNDERLTTASENRIAIIIFSFRLQPFYDEVIPRFLLALEPRVKNGKTALQTLLKEELIFQSKNLPGACLDVLKQHVQRSEIVRDAVHLAERYFEELRPCHRSAINSMGVLGLERASRVKAARQSRQMNAQMREVSIFAKLCTTSYTLYGGPTWQTFVSGRLGEVSDMRKISHSAEFSRMPGIDPDGMAIRRHEANQMIRVLELQEQSNHSHDL